MRLPFRGPRAPHGHDFPRRPRPAGGFVRPVHQCACGAQAPTFYWEILGRCHSCGSQDGPVCHELFLVPGHAPHPSTQIARWPVRIRQTILNPAWRDLRRKGDAA